MAKNTAYGGVVFDATGRLLLRRPSGGFDGTAWTFAKGRPDPGEKPEQTALREVLKKPGCGLKSSAPFPANSQAAPRKITIFSCARWVPPRLSGKKPKPSPGHPYLGSHRRSRRTHRQNPQRY